MTKTKFISRKHKVSFVLFFGIGLGIAISLAIFYPLANPQTTTPLQEEDLAKAESNLTKAEKASAKIESNKRKLESNKKKIESKNNFVESNKRKAENQRVFTSQELIKFQKRKETIILDLNKADTIDLQILKGVGVSYSKRIYGYGKLLGGYTRMEQLMEVYDMTPELYNSIVPSLRIDTSNIRKININIATIKQLNRHPYIDFYQAKAIINLRQETGKIDSLSQLKLLYHFTPEQIENLLPYLRLE